MKSVKLGFSSASRRTRLSDDNTIGAPLGGDEAVARLCFKDLSHLSREVAVAAIDGRASLETVVKPVFEAANIP